MNTYNQGYKVKSLSTYLPNITPAMSDYEGVYSVESTPLNYAHALVQNHPSGNRLRDVKLIACFGTAYSAICLHKLIMLRHMLLPTTPDIVDASLAQEAKASKKALHLFISSEAIKKEIERAWHGHLEQDAASLGNAPNTVEQALTAIEEITASHLLAINASMEIVEATIEDDMQLVLSHDDYILPHIRAKDKVMSASVDYGCSLANEALGEMRSLFKDMDYVDADWDMRIPHGKTVAAILTELLKATAHNEMAHLINLQRAAYRIHRKTNIDKEVAPQSLAIAFLN